jgi:hypothetical protein
VVQALSILNYDKSADLPQFVPFMLEQVQVHIFLIMQNCRHGEAAFYLVSLAQRTGVIRVTLAALLYHQ